MMSLGGVLGTKGADIREKMMAQMNKKKVDGSQATMPIKVPIVGDRVLAKVSGWKKPYSGVVESVNKGEQSFVVLFDDGERIDDVQQDEIVEIEEKVPVGARVTAKIKGWKKGYSGVVERAEGAPVRYAILFDDGEQAEQVSRAEILEVLSKPSDLETGSANKLSKGSRVTAQIKGWKTGYDGVIQNVNAKGLFQILFDDGEVVESVSRTEIVKVLSEPDANSDTANDLQVGTRVSAKLTGWKKTYDGEVKAVGESGFCILFDDGEMADDVNRDEITSVLSQPKTASLQKPKSPASPASTIAVGARVSAKLTGWKQAYDGVVESAGAKGYRILFDDGEVADDVKSGEITKVLSSPKPASPKNPRSSTSSAPDIEVGTRVSAKITGWKQAYDGVVEAAGANGYRILFDDGEIADDVKSGEITKVLSSPKPGSPKRPKSPASPALDIEVGTRVSAKITGWKQAYNGVIEAAGAKGYRILFDDGEVADDVKSGEITKVLSKPKPASPISASLKAPALNIAVGTRVSAKITGWKQAYEGAIEAVGAKGYRILFDDGEIVDDVKSSDIAQVFSSPRLASPNKPKSPISPALNIAVGSRVSAKLSGWKQAYDGLVEAAGAKGYRILFDDGEIADNVSPKEITSVLSKPSSAELESPTPGIAVGTRVSAKLSGWKQAYEGVIEASGLKGYRILFDDGEVAENVSQSIISVIATDAKARADSADAPTELRQDRDKPKASPRSGGTTQTVSPRSNLGDDSDLLAFLNDEKEILVFSIGDRVSAQMEGWKQAYDGVILAKNDEELTYKIKFTDGEIVDAVTESQVIGKIEQPAKVDAAPVKEAAKDPQVSQAPLTAADIGVGDIVMARLPTWKRAYKGEIKRFNFQGKTYKIVFEDGEKANAVTLSCIQSIVSKKAATATQKTFTSPDGQLFTDQQKYKRHMYETYYLFKGKTGDRESLIKPPGSIDGQTFDLHSLTDCTVRLLCWSSQVQADVLKGCKVFIGPTESSVFIRDCHNCEFTIACRQLRLRDCRGCTFNLFSNVDPVIETSTDLVFRPFNGAYPGLRHHFERAKLNPEDNHWRLVFDFNVDGCDGFGVPGPHYALEEAKEGKFVSEWVEDSHQGPGPCENPVPYDAVATSISDGGGIHQGSTHVSSSSTKSQKAPAGSTTNSEFIFAWATPETLIEGAVVRVNFNRESKKPLSGDFYQGIVKSVNMDGSASILYDDGDEENDCKIQFIKVGASVSRPKSKDQEKAGSPPVGTKADAHSTEGPSEAQPSVPAATTKAQTSASSKADLEFCWASKAGMPTVVKGMTVLVNFDRESGNLDPSPSSFYQGTVAAANPDGSFEVHYDDGDQEPQVDLKLIKIQVPKKASSPRVPAKVAENLTVTDSPPQAPKMPSSTPRVMDMEPITLKASRPTQQMRHKQEYLRASEGRRANEGRRAARQKALSFVKASIPGQVLVGAVVLVNRDMKISSPTWADLTKGIVEEENVDGTFAIRFDNGEIDELCSYDQIQVGVEEPQSPAQMALSASVANKTSAKARAESRKFKEQEAARTNLLARELDSLKNELTAIREGQRRDQLRMRMERKAQEDRIMNENRRRAREKAAAQLESKQMLLVDALRKEIGEQRHLHSKLMGDHQNAMNKLNEKLTEMVASANSPSISPAQDAPHAVDASAPVSLGFAEMASYQAELETVRNEIQAARAAMEVDRRNAASHNKRMQELARAKQLERGWNSSVTAQKAVQKKDALVKAKEKKQRHAQDAALLEQAMTELKKTRQEHAQLIQKSRGPKRTTVPSAKPMRDNHLRRELDEKTRLAARHIQELYETYESLKSSTLVHAPRPSVICTAEWSQRVSELRLKPLPFRSRAHNDSEWRRVGLALCTIEASYSSKGTGVEGRRIRADQVAKSKFYKEWLDWSISSNRELTNVSISPLLAVRIELIDPDDSCANNDQEQMVLQRLTFTHRQCERRMLKTRLQQNGDFARAHYVPDPPLSAPTKLRNALYKKVCAQEWAEFCKAAANATVEEGIEAMATLEKFAAEDQTSKQKILASQIAARKLEAANDFSQWKTVKRKTEIKSKVVNGIRGSDISKRTPYPRPAGAVSDASAALAADRPVPLRYVGAGRLAQPETNYIRAAGRVSLPESSNFAVALNSKAQDPGLSHGKPATVWAAKSQNQHDPWSDVEATKVKLDNIQEREVDEARAATERQGEAQEGFLEWEEAVKREETALRALKSLDFVQRCFFNRACDADSGCLAGDGRLDCFFAPGDLCSWKLIGKAMHSTFHSISRSNTLFSTWADWTSSNVVNCFSKLLFEPHTCLITSDDQGRAALCGLQEPRRSAQDQSRLLEDRFPQGALVLICVESFGPSGKLSPEKMASLLDAKRAVLCVIDANGLGHAKNDGKRSPGGIKDRLTLREGQNISSFLSGRLGANTRNRDGAVNAKCFVYLVPQLLAKVLFTCASPSLSSGSNGKRLRSSSTSSHGSAGNPSTVMNAHLLFHRLKDKQLVSSRVRALCAEQWARFAPPVRWFADSLELNEEHVINGELAVVRRLYSSERLRARVVENTDPVNGLISSEAIKSQANRLWQAAVNNGALQCSSVSYQVDVEGTPCMVPPLNNAGRAAEGIEWVRCSLRVGDVVCIAERNMDGFSKLASVAGGNSSASWFNGASWKIVEEINAVRHSVLLKPFPSVRSVGNGALVYRIVVDNSRQEGSEDGTAFENASEESVHISTFAGALVVRFVLSSSKAKAKTESSESSTPAFTMFHLPQVSSTFEELDNELTAWSQADKKTHRYRETIRNSSAREVARDHILEIQRETYERVKRLLHGPPASSAQATWASDKIGHLLFRLDRLGYEESSLLFPIEMSEREEKELSDHAQQQAMVYPDNWRELWVDWLQKSDKWQEFQSLGFKREDMLSVVEKKWIEMTAKYSGYNSRKSKRDIGTQSELIVRELREILATKQ